METKSVLEQILDWTKEQSLWVQDALRRIIKNDRPNQADIDELVLLCKEENLSKDEKIIKVTPLEPKDLPSSDNKNKSVSLKSIGNLQNINRLPSDQTIHFGDNPGLTVIYGENGSGKTGYSRVLKKVCRSRGAEPTILPDAFRPEATELAKATIYYEIEKNVAPAFYWNDEGKSNPELANVFVFDSQTAEHYINYDDDVSFTPFGLDILTRLVIVYDLVGKKIDEDIQTLEKEIEVCKKNWNYADDNKVAKILNNLNHYTDKKTIEELALLSKEETEQLKVIQEILKSDPLKKSLETRAASQRVQSLLDEMDGLIEFIDENKVLELKNQLQQVQIKSKLAKEYSQKSFIGYLEGTGSAIWKNMWESAKSYSVNQAYPGKEFPVLEDAKCVLCQQDFSGDAPLRMAEFENFIRDKSQQEAKEASGVWDKLVAEIDQLENLNLSYEGIKADLQNIEEPEKNKIENFVKQSSERLKQIKKFCKDEVWNDNISSLPESPRELLSAFVTTLEKRAVVEESANDPKEKEKLELEKNELETRGWLHKNLNDVLKQIDRLNTLEYLETCKPTSSKFITDKNSEITRNVVTKVFCDSFKYELEKLGMKTLDVKLEEIGGIKAHTKFGLRLPEAQNSKVYEIASEGEQRCIALAAFLAELSQTSHKSALVFDDPSSSLDHRYRENIAIRLVQESKIRQVIIFTHDTIFLNDLQEFAKDNSPSSKFYFLEWCNNKPGYVREGLPWDCKSPEDRIDKLEKLQRELEKTWNLVPSHANIDEISHAYSFLRATIERIVEKVVFNDVVFRYRTYINFSNLKKVVGFDKSEWIEIQRLFKRCSDITEAHDKAQGQQISIPTPDLLKKDIEDTLTFLKQIRARINQNK